MILRKVVIVNFRQIYGTNQIDFAPSGDRNVTVVLGTNGGGKTTLLSAFRWCLYGEVDLQNPHELICHKAIQETPVGGTVEASVSLMFEADNAIYHARRRLTMQRLNGGSLEIDEEPKLELYVTGADGNAETVVEPISLIQRLLPKPLARFFFFRGEDMEQLASQTAYDELKKGTETFFDVTLLERSVKHLEQVGTTIEREIRNIAKGDARSLSDEVQIATDLIADLKARYDHAQGEVLHIISQQETIDAELAMRNEVKPLLERRAELAGTMRQQESHEGDLRRRLAARVSEDGFLAFAGDSLETPLSLANAAVQKGELPAKIKPQFVDDLLGNGTCVCARPIDAAAESALRAYRNHTGLAVLEEKILDLRAGIGSLNDRRQRFLQSLSELRTEYSQIVREIQATQSELSRIKSELEGRDFGLEEVRALQNRLREKNSEFAEARVAIDRLASEITDRGSKLEELKARRDKMLGESEQAMALRARKEALASAEHAMNQLKDEWAALVQRYLDGKLKETWNRVAQIERLVEFTPDFHLVIKERGGEGQWISSAPSQANQRALALSFIGALIDLSKEVGTSPARGAVFKGGEYCLVMDAPFATMDKHLKMTIPRGLVSLVPQVILISSYDQWEGEVAGALEPRVGKRYVLELHKPGREGEDRTVPFGGKAVDYEVAERVASTDWSVIREVA